MEKVQRILRYAFSRDGISDAANIFTIGAFALAFYAIINPGTVSKYLETVAQEAAQTNEILTSVDGSTSSIDVNTKALAGEVPYWLELSSFVHATHSHGSRMAGLMEMTIENNSNAAFSDVDIKILFADGSIAYQQIGIVVPPRESVEFLKPQLKSRLATYCLSAVSEKTGAKLYEYRRFSPNEDPHGRTYFVSWRLGTSPEAACA